MRTSQNRCASDASSEHLNIAMIGHKRVPSREGGVEVVVEELSTRMVERGHSVMLFNRKGHHVAGSEYDSEKLDEYKGVRLCYVPTFKRKGYAAASSSYFAAIKAALGPYDIVHYHAEGPCHSMWIPKLFGKKCIATIHGLDYKRQKWDSAASGYILSGEKSAVKRADAIIVLSRGVQDYFKKTYGRDTIYIPNGVDRPTRRKPDIISEKYGLGERDYFMYLGRLVPEKGAEYLIRAFKETDTDKKLVIAGSSSDTDEFVKKLHSLAEGDERIIFTGFVQGDELTELYSNCYSFVLPSELEGMPLTLLEAMSYGNCCIISDIAECTDVAGDKAIVFKKGDIDDLKAHLQQVSDDPELAERYRSGTADFICDSYKWDNVVDETLKVYMEQMGR